MKTIDTPTPIFRSDLQAILSQQVGSRVIVHELRGEFSAHCVESGDDVEVGNYVPARYNWKPVVGSALANLEKGGFKLTHVNNGGGWEAVNSRKEAVALAVACDDCNVRVVNADGQGCTVYLVLGNSPEELFCDWSVNPATDAALDAAIETFCAVWEGKRCPIVAVEGGAK